MVREALISSRRSADRRRESHPASEQHTTPRLNGLSGPRPGPESLMTVHYSRIQAAVAGITACGLLVSLAAPPLSGQTPAPTATRSAQTTASPRTAPAPAVDADGGWPRDHTTPMGAALRVFQPQVANWDGQKHMTAYS